MKAKIRSLLLKPILSFITSSTDSEIHDIITAIIRRYEISDPDWDLIYLALPKNNPCERNRLLQKFICEMSNQLTEK